MKKKLAMLLTSILVVNALSGCGNGSEDSQETSSTGSDSAMSQDAVEGMSIGFSGDYLSDFMSYVVDGVNDASNENGVTVSIQDAEFDASKQLQQVENFINAGVDAVIIKPVDADACEPMAQACKEAGVYFLAVNSEVNCETDAFIGSDHKYSGVLQGEYVAEQLPDGGKIAFITGDLTNTATVSRTDGAKEALAKGKNLEVVSEQEGMWMRDEAMNKMENWLNSGMEIDAVIANSDEMAIGAAMVCQENGIDDIIICGIDASEDALKMLKDETLSMTVFQNGYQQGYQGVEAAIALVNGEKVESYIDVPYERVLKDEADEYLEKIGK